MGCFVEAGGALEAVVELEADGAIEVGVCRGGVVRRPGVVQVGTTWIVGWLCYARCGGR